MAALSLVTLALLKRCRSSKAGETDSTEALIKDIGGEENRSAFETEMQNLLNDGFLTGLMDNAWVQRTKKGDKEIAELGTAKFAKQVDMRILAEVPEKASTKSIGFDLLAKCLGVLGVPDGRKKIQDLINAGYLDLVAQGRLRRTDNGDTEYRKKGKPFQRKR